MIKSPATFPFPGSYALHEVAGETQLVRILWLQRGHTIVAYPLRLGASGNKEVELEELLDGTPLSPAERDELTALERKLAGVLRPRKADLAREEALRLRDIRSGQLRALIEYGIKCRLIQPDVGQLALDHAA